MNVDIQELSKYPFLGTLKEFLRLSDFDLKEILLNKENIFLRFSIEKIKSLNTNNYLTFPDPEINLKSFLVSLYLASQLGSIYVEKLAERESKRLSSELQKENIQKILEIARVLVSDKVKFKEVKSKKSFSYIAVDIKSYLKYAAYLGDYNWALSFHEISKGEVLLTKKEIIRLVEEAYRQWIIMKCNELQSFYIAGIEGIIEEIYEKIPPPKRFVEEKIEYSGVDPPCMRRLIADLKSGKKLSHMGNFTLASYLRAIGYSVERALELFKNLPDFKEEIARYQIEHIYGLRGGRKVYSVPSCITLRAANLCFPESPGCDGIKHPLQFIKKMKNVGK